MGSRVGFLKEFGVVFCCLSVTEIRRWLLRYRFMGSVSKTGFGSRDEGAGFGIFDLGCLFLMGLE